MTPSSPGSRMHALRPVAATIAWLCAMLIAGCKAAQPIPEPYLLTGNQHARCMQVLREGLSGDEFWASIYAGEALVRDGYGFEVIPLFHERLARESDPRKRAGYAGVLVRAGQRDALVDLQDLLLGDDVEAQIMAAQAMFRTASVADATLLEEAMAEGRNGRLRLYAAGALALTRDAKTLDFIREQLHSDDPANRYVAADIIAVLGSARDDLETLLDLRDRAGSEFERFFVLRALAIFGNEDARAALVQLLRHSDPTIRARAVFVMAEAWIVEQSDQLYAMLNDPSLAVRVRAAQALLILSNPTAPERYLRLR